MADSDILAQGVIPAHLAIPTLTAEDVRRVLRRAVERAGSQKALAMQAGCSYSFLNDVLHGRREPSGPLLLAIGLERVVTYRPIPHEPIIAWKQCQREGGSE